MPTNAGAEKEVTLVTIQPSTDLKTGKFVARMDFGEIIDNSEAVSSRLAVPEGVSPMGAKEVVSLSLLVFADFDRLGGYPVGSKWKLKIEDAGKITLERVRS